MSTPPTAAPSRTSPLLPALCVAACALALLTYGPVLASCFHPGSNNYPDFVQEWLSARNFWSGDPVYSPQREAMKRHTGENIAAFDTELPWNAHPPVAVLVALPFGFIHNYPTAHFAWNLVTAPLFVLGLVLLAWELGLAARWWSIAAGVALVVSCPAVQSHTYQGQLNSTVFLFLVLAWVANRRGCAVAAGGATGVAIALKLFPGLLLVYFAATGRWRAAGAAVLTALGLNLAALALFGPEAFDTYVRNVLPSLDVFRGSWANVSLTGYWTRVGVALGTPALGRAAAVACQLAVFAAVWRVGRRAVQTVDHDRAFATAVAGMLLASPVAWTHYFVLLPLPILVAWRHPPGRVALVALALATAAPWIPERFAPGLVLGDTVRQLKGTTQNPGGVGMAVLCLGVFPTALVTLFLLVGFAKPALTPRSS